MARPEPPIIGLAPYGRDWVPNIFLTSRRDRGEFLGFAEWLCREFPAQVIERYGGEGEEAKEYWTLRVDGSDWLLMRCYYPRGISLAAHSMTDLPAFEAIARAVCASPVGWRYRWLRILRRLSSASRASSCSQQHGRLTVPILPFRPTANHVDPVLSPPEASRNSPPDEADWRIEPWGLDTEWAYKYFGGKTRDEAVRLFEKRIPCHPDALVSMPGRVLGYYLGSYIDYLTSDAARGDADGASCFISDIDLLTEFHPDRIRPLWADVVPVLKMLAERQEDFGADWAIYGSFRAQLQEVAGRGFDLPFDVTGPEIVPATVTIRDVCRFVPLAVAVQVFHNSGIDQLDDSSTRSDVLRVFGPPDAAGGGEHPQYGPIPDWVRYDRGDGCIRFSFDGEAVGDVGFLPPPGFDYRNRRSLCPLIRPTDVGTMTPGLAPGSSSEEGGAMKRLRGSLLVLALAGAAGRSDACLNDVELEGHEREFRSQYSQLAKAPEVPRERRLFDREDLLLGGGAALLMGAFGLAVRRDRMGA